METKKHFDEARAALAMARASALNEIAGRAEGYARERAPVDTGALLSSIASAVEDGAAVVGSPLGYAPWVELGGPRRAPRPFLRPAMEEHAEEYREIIEAALRGGDH